MKSTDFQSLVNKYSQELKNMSAKNLGSGSAVSSTSAANQTEAIKSSENLSENNVQASPVEVKSDDESPTETSAADKTSDAIDIELTNTEENLIPGEQGNLSPAQVNPTSRTYAEFLEYNTALGELKVQVFAANQAFPISGAEIVLYKKFPDKDRVFYRIITNVDGIVDNIILPAPDSSQTMNPYETGTAPYEIYQINASHPDFYANNVVEVAIFEGIKSIQTIRHYPKLLSEDKQ